MSTEEVVVDDRERVLILKKFCDKVELQEGGREIGRALFLSEMKRIPFGIMPYVSIKFI